MLQLTKDYTWESVFRVRISAGWKVKEILGNFCVKSTDLLTLPNLDKSNSLFYKFQLQSQTSKTPAFYIQSVILYSNAKGERRIRVLNTCVPLTNDIKEIYQGADP